MTFEGHSRSTIPATNKALCKALYNSVQRLSYSLSIVTIQYYILYVPLPSRSRDITLLAIAHL